MRVVAPGLLTTVQDLGRVGFARDGVSPSGAMDGEALRAANLLVRNPESAAALEITLEGPEIEFADSALISICGAALRPQISGVELPSWHAIYVQEGAVLEFGGPHWGCRAYLAVAGGIDVPQVMCSRSTFLRAAIGGFQGRALRAGDMVPLGDPGGPTRHAMAEATRSLGPLPFALTGRHLNDAERLYHSGTIRFLRGPHWDVIDETDRRAFVDTTFHVSSRSDRMGYRLSGPRLGSRAGAELISTAVVTGTVQVPPGGEPILLMADRQTTGGYPMVAQVIRADLGAVAQLKPGDEIRFVETTIEAAQQTLRDINAVLDEMRRADERASSRP